ncbi:MAG: type IV toxin-antitoxin system AbiEi family antitoxin [Alphaproteobacteria bacterium]|nr:type IV toxin-antitoxin system AbiEi family antitoxin [Alphaproteobacteria bacterium]
MSHMPKNGIMTSSALHQLGISDQLKKTYIKSGWLRNIGKGAVSRFNEIPSFYSAINAIQNQLHLPIHVGGRSALSLHGRSHYIRLGKETFFLFGLKNIKLPLWFKNYTWDPEFIYMTTDFINKNLYTENITQDGFSIVVSSLERAIMEALFLIPKYQGTSEAFHLLEGLVDIRPQVVQELLENCRSIRVKRLFLLLAEKANLPCVKDLDLRRINLGTGKLSLAKNGFYNHKYKIVVPKDLENE